MSINTDLRFHNLERGEAATTTNTETTLNARIYSSLSDCYDSTREGLHTTAQRISSWATNPNTQVGFFLILGGALLGMASIALGAAYDDCLKTNSDACHKKTTTTTCSTDKNGYRHCRTTTTSHEEDLLNSAIGFAAGSVFCLVAGLCKLCNIEA